MTLTPQQIEAVNRRVHEVCGRGCWHEFSYMTAQGLGTSCMKCGRIGVRNPDYWNDANACLEMWNNGSNSILIQRIPVVYCVTITGSSAREHVFKGYGETVQIALCDATLATVGDSVASVIEKAGEKCS